MLAIESSVARVEAALKIISKRELAALAGIPRSNLSAVGMPGWNPTRRILAALEGAIDRLPTSGPDNGDDGSGCQRECALANHQPKRRAR
jgi:hypothetical protein